MSYNWTKSENHPITIIELTGDIDSEKKFEDIERISLACGTEHIVLLMHDVTYINSNACGHLITLKYLVENNGFNLYVVNPSPPVVAVLECLGANALITIMDSIDDVIKAVGS